MIKETKEIPEKSRGDFSQQFYGLEILNDDFITSIEIQKCRKMLVKYKITDIPKLKTKKQLCLIKKKKNILDNSFKQLL